MKYLIFLIILNLPLISNATDKSIWPYPEDTPKKQNLSIGLASDKPIDISRFLLARGVLSAKLNHDGLYIAYMSNVTGRKQVWLKSTLNGTQKQLTFGNGVDGFYWHPDGKNILYSADNDGDEQQAFYLISISGEEEKILLVHSDSYRYFGAFDDDGKRFSYASTERNGRDFDLYTYDFITHSSKMIYESKFGFYPRSWRPKTSQLLMAEVRGEDAVNLYILDADSGKSNVLYNPDIAADFNSFAWKKNGEGFYFSSNLNGEMNEVLFYDVISHQTTTIVKNTLNLEKVRLCNNDKSLIWTINQNGYDKLQVLNLVNNKHQEIDIHKGVYELSCTSENNLLSVLVSSSDTPGTLYLHDLDTGLTKSFIDPEMAGINPQNLKHPKVVTFKARDGVTIQGLLYLPPVIHKGLTPPVVINVHGGPTSQSRPSWRPINQYLLGKGIAVLDINVRGSTGFGKKYARLDDKKNRLNSVRDLVDAINWLEKSGQVNSEKSAVMGGSYGGYMVNAVMGLYPSTFKAGASFVGVADWVRALKTASPGLKASDIIEYGDIREEKWQKFYANNSPINTVGKITSPMFFEHGVNDPRDPIEESDSMVKILRQNNVPVTYLRFSDEGHRISKVSNKILFYRELANFLERHLN